MLLLLLACGDGTSDPPAESGETAETDTDTGADTETDTGEDSGADTATDTARDTGRDTGDEGDAVRIRRGDLTGPEIGFWTDEVSWSTYWSAPPAVGDLDGDGRDELVLSFSGGPYRILRFDAYTGVQEPTVTLTGDAAYRPRPAIVDETLVVEGPDNRWHVFTGLPADGTAITDAPTTIEGEDDSLMPMSAGDVDGDGDDDLALRGNDALMIFTLPLPAGILTAAEAYLTVSDGASFAGAGDLDGDGDDDLLFGGHVVFGPVPVGTYGLEELGAVSISVVGPWEDSSPVVLPDLFGGGRATIALLDWSLVLLDGYPRGGGPVVPDRGYDCTVGLWEPLFSKVLGVTDGDADGRPGIAIASDAWGDGDWVATWTDLPPNGADCRSADVFWETDGEVALAVARLGGPATGDLVFTGGDSVGIGLAFGWEGADADRDTYAGDDCDDTDASVFPGAPETADGRDEDCDGEIDEDVGRVQTLSASPALVGEVAHRLGTELAAWDHDGDDVESLAVLDDDYEQPGLWVVRPGDARAGFELRRYLPRSGARHVTVPGDFDGDGLDDLAVSHEDTCAWILPGGSSGDSDIGDASSVLLEPGGDYEAGHNVSRVGDVDGDGLAEVLVGGYTLDATASSTSAGLLYFGGALTDRAEPDVVFEHEGGGVEGYSRGAPVGDLDGDGLDDIALQTPESILVFPGTSRGRVGWGDARMTFEVRSNGIATGDLDEDGRVELYVHGWLEHEIVSFDQRAPGSYTEADARATIALAGEVHSGESVVIGHGAGGPRLLVGEPSMDSNGREAGRVWAFAGPLDGALDEDAAIAGWRGSAALDRAGTSMVRLDVAGVPTLAVGVPGLNVATAYDGGVDLVALP